MAGRIGFGKRLKGVTDMFNFLLFYLCCLKCGFLRDDCITNGLAIMLVFLALRYVLTSIFLCAAWRDYEDGSPIMPFLPVARYYCYGSLAGYDWSGIAACIAAAIWLIGLMAFKGSAALALNSCIVFFTNAACAWGFADRAGTNRTLPALLSALGFPWLSLLYVLEFDG